VHSLSASAPVTCWAPRQPKTATLSLPQGFPDCLGSGRTTQGATDGGRKGEAASGYPARASTTSALSQSLPRQIALPLTPEPLRAERDDERRQRANWGQLRWPATWLRSDNGLSGKMHGCSILRSPRHRCAASTGASPVRVGTSGLLALRHNTFVPDVSDCRRNRNDENKS
jgi:hypothetical protein